MSVVNCLLLAACVLTARELVAAVCRRCKRPTGETEGEGRPLCGRVTVEGWRARLARLRADRERGA